MDSPSETHTMLSHEQNHLTGSHLINLSKKRGLERQRELLKHNQNFPFIGPFHVFSTAPTITLQGEANTSCPRAFRVLAPKVQGPRSSHPQVWDKLGLSVNLLLTPATTTGYGCGKGCLPQVTPRVTMPGKVKWSELIREGVQETWSLPWLCPLIGYQLWIVCSSDNKNQI